MHAPQPDLRRRVLSSLAWMGSAQLLGQLASWASTILVIRLLEPADYGAMAMATVFFSFLLMLSDLGIGAAIVQVDELGRDDARFIQGFVVLFNLAGMALTLVAAPWIAAFFAEPRLIPILQALCLCFPLMALYVYPQAMLQRELQYARKARVDLATMLGSAMVSLGCALAGFGVWALVAGVLATHAMRAVGFSVAHRGAPLPSWSWTRASRFLGFGGVVVLDRVLWFLYTNLDVMIAGRVLGKELLGFYSVALTLSALPLAKMMPIVNQVSFSAFSRIQHDRVRVRANVVRTVRFGFASFLPIFWGMALVAPDAIPLLLGEDWREVVVPIQLIALILPLKGIATLLPPALFGVGRPGTSVVNMAITASIMGTAFWVGAQAGLRGLATSWVVAFPVAFAIVAVRALKALDVPLVEVWRGVRWTLLAGVSMAGAVLLAGFPIGASNPLLRVSICVATGALVYLWSMRSFDRAAISELRGLLAR